MYPAFLFWAGALVASLVTSGLCIRILSTGGVPLGANLVTRGAVCLLLVGLFARRKRLSLRPRSPGIQLVRAMLAGLALTLYTLSYRWLTASAVAVLSNVDVPLLLVLGPLVGVRASTAVRLLALASISFLVWYVSGLELHTDLYWGLGTLALGTLLLCFGYLFIQRSMREENEAITILTPALALMACGLVEAGSGGHAPFTWTGPLVVAAVGSGAAMFGAYVATMRLYALTDLAWAEFPTLLAAVLIQPLELGFMSVPLERTYLLSSAGFVVSTLLILRWHSRQLAPQHA